ncbi:MAG: hypothetical protein BWY11_00433 [Firmicutes bacterium ADurb.Bin182]|nr:MAG: hypothetical protein BWY11_00433 [Firmicutes bacterium ADurb.Bin182]
MVQTLRLVISCNATARQMARMPTAPFAAIAAGDEDPGK